MATAGDSEPPAETTGRPVHPHLRTLTCAALAVGAWTALSRAMHAAETREAERRG